MKKRNRTLELNVRFAIKAEPGNRVQIAGSFNGWDPTKTLLAGPDESGNYSVTLALPEGSYEYLFVINGLWQTDPSNPKCVPNVYGSSNSVIDVVRGPDV